MNRGQERITIFFFEKHSCSGLDPRNSLVELIGTLARLTLHTMLSTIRSLDYI
jgi:hypothetical protein